VNNLIVFLSEKSYFCKKNDRLLPMISRYFSLFFLFFITWFHSQEYYSELRKKYWQYDENDPRGLVYVNLYISSAKKENNYAELYQAYGDAIRYSPDEKLQYADSSITAAKRSKDANLLGSAYISKGSVYYFNYRKFKPALDEYLKAYRYLENSDDLFLKHKNMYHIAVVKSYLGYHQEAKEIFKRAISFFEPYTKSDIHENLIFNNRKGYLNSIHQLIVCEQELGNFAEAEKLTQKAFSEMPNDPEFNQELSYFYKSKGINEFNRKNYAEALKNFEKSLPGLKKVNDFSWISEIYYHIGLCQKYLGRNEKAIAHYQSVDSIFTKHHFIFPDTRSNYEELIDYYKANKDEKKELYYTKQLLRVDSTLSNDFKYLSTKIHKEYDTKALLKTQNELQDSNTISRKLVIILMVSIAVLLSLAFYWFRRKKNVQKKYDEILSELEKTKSESHIPTPKTIKEEKIVEKSSKLDMSTIHHLKTKFSEFEKDKRFLEKGITAGRLAAEFDTNATYFSQFVNEFKDSNFNTYLNKLRVDYAVHQIYNHKEWRKYSVEDIAIASGFSNRQSFSNFFFEEKGMRPADFLRKRNEEIEEQRKGLQS